MGRIDQLIERYQKHISLPQKQGLPLSQRVWFLVYPPEEERRLINRIDEFAIATKDAALSWQRVDLTGVFADWMDTFDPEERDACLSDPALVENYADPGFRDFVCARIAAQIQQVPSDQAERTVFGVTGLMDLYDFVHVSAIVEGIDGNFPGILAIFFPGEREGNTYRFLSARAGWNYLAVPILAES